MKTYPIAIELTAWVELGLNQYEVTIDEISKITVKRTDDVLHAKELTDDQAQQLIEAIELIAAPVMLNPADKTLNKADSSYELIIESAHFSMAIGKMLASLSSTSLKTTSLDGPNLASPSLVQLNRS